MTYESKIAEIVINSVNNNWYFESEIEKRTLDWFIRDYTTDDDYFIESIKQPNGHIYLYSEMCLMNDPFNAGCAVQAMMGCLDDWINDYPDDQEYKEIREFLDGYDYFDLYCDHVILAYYKLKEKQDVIKIIDDAYNEKIEKYSEIKQQTVKKQKTYILKDNKTGYYKIGRSANPKHREKTLQAENPNYNLIKVFDNNIEKELHHKYSRQRLRGEWFNLNEIQLKYICKHY